MIIFTRAIVVIPAANPTRRGPQTDILRAKVIKGPDAQVSAMLTEEAHVTTELSRQGDIDELSTVHGFTGTLTFGFHIGYIGLNCRPNRDYLTPPYQCNPAAAEALSDVWFRKALFHLYNQEEIVASIYGYTVTPVQSLVPPAQGGWVNPEVRKPAFGTTLAEQVLTDHGYTYDSGIGNWRMPSGDPVPTITLWTPTYEVAPTSAEHGARFVQELNNFGLTSIVHEPRDFTPYMEDVQIGDFDLYMSFMDLGRSPTHLYTMCHSDFDAAHIAGAPNYAGCNDPYLDECVSTFWTSLDRAETLMGCYEAQRTLFNWAHPDCAFAYLPLYSSNHVNAFHPDLRGIVAFHWDGFGSNNAWTHLNIRWQPGLERYHEIHTDKTVVDWIWADEPELLNPCSALTVYAWDIIDKTIDGMIGVNPYTLEDLPWLATNWGAVEWVDGGGPGVNWMNVTFYLNTTVTWQDGHPFSADDAAFSWLFLRDWEVPRYLGMTRWLEDVDVIDTYTVRAILNTTSQFLIYDLAETAALLPRQVWDRSWPNLAAIMQYDPTEPYSVAPGYTLGPTPPPTNLFGTGPYIFQFYDLIWLEAELWQNPNYFKYTNEIFEQKVEMFHRIGDVNRDGYIDIFDLAAVARGYGKRIGWPGYNPDADLNWDGIIDLEDLSLVTRHWGERREYPVP